MAQQRLLEEMDGLCVCLNLRRISRVVTRHYDEAYAAAGLRSTQAPILFFLMLNGETKMGVLADQLAMDKSTLSRNFTLLEDRGLVSRVALDGRTTGVSITAAGQQSLEAICAIWQQVQDQILKDVGLDDWMGTLAVLKSMAGENGQIGG